jgi:amino acid adenylation domain-containing protein
MTAQLLHDWVTVQAHARPGATAVVCGGTRLSYGELDATSNRLARVLREAGCRQGEPIGVLMSKSPMAVAALLGISKADAVYVPLDPTSPSARLRKMIKICGITRILAGGAVEPVLTDLLEEQPSTRLAIGWIDREASRTIKADFSFDDLLVYSADRIETHNRAFHPALVFFTSASSGVPKGVILTHANVIHCVEWTNRFFGMQRDDRLSCHWPLHVDMSALDIFTAAAAGAELHLVPPLVSVLPNNLSEFIRSSGITHWCSMPSVLSYMAQFDLVQRDSFPALRRVAWSGDAIASATLAQWMARLPHVRFTALYGPTETSIVSSAYTVPAGPEPNDVIPIGSACTGKELYVLNPGTLDPVAAGEIGELYIGGAGVSRGYWGDLAQTNACFMHHPQRVHERLFKTGDLARVGGTGLVHVVGRRDEQIKKRGHRVELGEIEMAMQTIDAVKASAIVALDRGGFDGALICCAYVPAIANGCSPVWLRRELSRLVPSYMLPIHWLATGALPLDGSGLTDRARVRELFEEQLSAHERRPVA